MLWIDMCFIKLEIKLVFIEIVDFNCRFVVSNSIVHEAIQRSDLSASIIKFNAFESVLTTIFDDSNLCISVRWLDVRLKKKLNDSLINFSMNCESLLSISNFWIELWKLTKISWLVFNDLSLLNDLYEYKLIVLKNSYENMKLSFNQVEKKSCFVCWTFCLTRHIMSFDCFIWHEFTTNNNLFAVS